MKSYLFVNGSLHGKMCEVDLGDNQWRLSVPVQNSASPLDHRVRIETYTLIAWDRRDGVRSRCFRLDGHDASASDIADAALIAADRPEPVWNRPLLMGAIICLFGKPEGPGYKLEVSDHYFMQAKQGMIESWQNLESRGYLYRWRPIDKG